MSEYITSISHIGLLGRNDNHLDEIKELAEVSVKSKPALTRIAIRNKGRTLFVSPDSVVQVTAQGNYVLLQCESASYVLRESITAMEEKLEPYGFIRIHRSVLINRSWVEEIRPYLTGAYGLRMRGGKEIKVTRTYKKNLKSLAELWLSNDSFLD